MSDFDGKVIERLKRLEREVERLQVKERPVVIADHGNLTGLGDNDHPQYLLTTGKAADSDKLDGNDSTAFATSTHNHDTAYLGITAKAADSDKLDGVDSTGFVNTTAAQTVAGIKTFSSIPVLPASDPTTDNQAVRKAYADTTFLAVTAKAAGSDVTTGTDDTKYVTSKAIQDSFGFTAVGRAILDDATLSDQRRTLDLKLTTLSVLNDDSATSITPTNIQGFLLLRTAGNGVMALATYDAQSGTAYCGLMAGTANVAVRTGILSGTTGTDGKFTVSAHTDGKIYFENRLGSNAYIGYVAI